MRTDKRWCQSAEWPHYMSLIWSSVRNRQTWPPSELDALVLIKMSVSPEAEPLVLDQCCLVSVAGRTERGISADLNSKTVTFSNGDIKHMLADGKAVSSVVAWCQRFYYWCLDRSGGRLWWCVTGVSLRHLPDNTHHLPNWSGSPSLPQQADWWDMMSHDVIWCHM